VNTEVVQILKALALQADVNIVTSPEVKGALTVSLANVPLGEALNLVTTLAGLKYAQIGNTYVVALPDDLSRATRELVTHGGIASETRVVSLLSQQAKRIREAVTSSIPRTDVDGWYDILTTDSVEGAAALGTAVPVANATPNAPAGAQGYLVVVGHGRKVGKVVDYIATLDRQISQAQFPDKADLKTTVVHIASAETERIKGALDRIIAGNPRRADFSVTATKLQELANGDPAQHVLMIQGPGGDVANLKQVALALDEELSRVAGIQTGRDGENSNERFYEIVELNYLEPRIAEFDLTSRVRGLTVSVLPDTVSPRSGGRSSESRTGESGDGGRGGSGGGSGSGGGESGGSGGNSGGAAGGEGGARTGTETTKMDRPIGREPMKLVLRGTRAQIEEAKQYLRLVDLAPRQVAVELRVMELSKDEAIRAGIDFNIFTGGAVKFIRLGNAQPDASNTAGIRLGGKDFGADVTVTLDKLANRNNLISRPNLLVMDGRSSGVFIGDRVRYIESVIPSQNGTTVTTGLVDVGVTLDVGARVGNAGNLTLDVQSEVSFLTGFLDVPLGGRLPQTSVRRTGSTLSIQSGETIAIGGLISEQDIKRASGVPILMDLPILGQLFRRTSNDKQRRELVIFVTARETGTPTRTPNLPMQDDLKLGRDVGKTNAGQTGTGQAGGR
jgi:type II secretory pathway component GspD/PulD (secretin)